MNNLIDIRQVVTQILGFLILLWGMRKFAWGPVMKVLEDRRAKIAGEFAAADQARAEANVTKPSCAASTPRRARASRKRSPKAKRWRVKSASWRSRTRRRASNVRTMKS